MSSERAGPKAMPDASPSSAPHGVGVLYNQEYDELDNDPPLEPWLLAGRRVLQVGCDRNALLDAAVARGALAWAVDPSEDALAEFRERTPAADARLGSSDDLPFDSGLFDLVVSEAPGVGQAAVAIAELARVCRPGGFVVLRRAR